MPLQTSPGQVPAEKPAAGRRIEMYGFELVRMEPEWWTNMALGCLAASSAATDLYCGKVLNIVTLPGLGLGILLAVQREGPAGVLDVLCAAGFTLLVLYPFYTAGGLGAGDIKLLAAVSAFMPAGSYLRCFAGAFVLGAAAGLVRLAVTKGRGHTLHFAVPVAASVLLYLAGLY